MKTVQKYNITSRKEVQEFIEKNEEKLGINEKEKKQLIKGVRGFKTTVEMRKIFIQECIKKIERKRLDKQGKFRHITKEERISIEILSTAGFQVSFIAAFVGKHRSSIKREIDRNAIEIWDIGSMKSPYRDKGQANIKCYVSEKAQEKAEANKLKNRKKCKLDRYKNLRWSVVALLRERKIEYSPDVIANLSKEGKIKGAEASIGANAIYRAVKERKYGLTINDLPHGRSYFKKRKNNPHTQTKEISERKKKISIEEMPEGARSEETYFEGDSIVGIKTGRHNTLITLVNKVSQFTFIRRSENKTAKATVRVLDELEKEILEMKKIIEIVLLDNGIEFSDFAGMMKSIKDRRKKRFKIYFAHPYASYERGSNENKNKLVRRYLKKGKLVESLTDEDILNIERKINNMPRKALGYKTPLEVFEINLKKKGIDTSFLNKYRIELPKCLAY